MNVILESLERYQIQLTRAALPRVEVLWRYNGADTRRRDLNPHDEAFLCNDIARWLRDDLNQRGIIIGREVQTQRGQRTDIYVEAVSKKRDANFQTVTVVIEVKGCWNAGVRSSLESQLVGQYLRSNGFYRGIYLVGWFVCDEWKNAKNELESKTIESAREEVKSLALVYDGKTNPERVAGLVLDCRNVSE